MGIHHSAMQVPYLSAAFGVIYVLVKPSVCNITRGFLYIWKILLTHITK